MTTKSTRLTGRRKASQKTTKPAKPYSDFPLFPHATRRWAKKIRGKLHYFGPWDDPDAALQRFLDQRDDLYAGRTKRSNGDGLTIRDLANRFLTHKRDLVDNGELMPRTWAEYKATCEHVITAFGLDRLVEDLRADDFQKLRRQLAKRYGPTALGNEINRVRIFFKFAFDEELIDRPIRYGQSFKRPSKATLRKHRAKNGERMIEAADIRRLLDAANVRIKAMILLAINCGFGNKDVATLPQKAIDFNRGWANYPRPKTGIVRRCPLWPETIEAMKVALDMRYIPKGSDAAELAFVTKQGHSFEKDTRDNPVTKEFAKLLRTLGLDRPGLGFYALRHTFETIGGESRDQVAVNYIMGHAPASNDMSAVYRERISDERLAAVTEYVREWLFGYAHILGYTDAAVALAKQIAEETGQAPDEAAWRSRKNPLWDALIGENHLKESSGRDALNLAGDGDEAAMAWIRARDWGKSRN